ncbi:MAG: SPOR domain-containing protein [Deltaproteobacteria bacterium]|nr:SPOR domain-containing protein [Deltaproteobacteria bacterium]
MDELDRARRTLIQRSTVLPRPVLAAVGIGAAFGLGILAGGIGEARGAAPAGDEDVLAAARARSVALVEKQGAIKLAFPAELLAPEARGGARPVVADGEKATTEKATTEKATTEKAATEKAPTEKGPADKGPADKAQVDKGPADKASADKAQPVEDDAPAPRADEERPSIQATLAKVLGGAPPTASAAPTPRPKSFALQVASLPQRAPAEELMKKLSGQGLNARVVVGEVGGREVFRVRVGSFAERDKAEAAKGKLAMPSFIVSE